MDDELDQIREKKRREMVMKLSGKEKNPVILIDEAHFAEAVGTHPRLVIDFWAEWCGPCRMVSPVIEELASEFKDKVTFGKCNTDENPRAAARFGIEAIPTLLIFSQGKMIERVIGAYPRDALKEKIIRAFGLYS